MPTEAASPLKLIPTETSILFQHAPIFVCPIGSILPSNCQESPPAGITRTQWNPETKIPWVDLERRNQQRNDKLDAKRLTAKRI